MVLDFRRKNAPPGSTTITLGSAPDRDTASSASACVDAPWAPFTIDFNLANIGGPSAGLMFSLAVIDKLTTGDLNGAKFVAGTGTIDADGKVGPIGGITHKMLAAHEAGATVFLVPADNCDEAKSGARGRHASWSRSTPSATPSTRCKRFPPVAKRPVADRGRAVKPMRRVVARRC